MTTETPVTEYINSLPTHFATPHKKIQEVCRERFGPRLKETMMFDLPTYWIDKQKRFTVQLKHHVITFYFFNCDTARMYYFPEKEPQKNRVSIPLNNNSQERLEKILLLIT